MSVKVTVCNVDKGCYISNCVIASVIDVCIVVAVCSKSQAAGRPCVAGASRPPPALAVSLLQSDVYTGRGEGVRRLLRLDEVPATVDHRL